MDFPSVAQLLAAVPLIGVLIALANVLVSTRNERRRTQPVVIAHRRDRLTFFEQQAGTWATSAVLKNEGGGPAFNVAFGVEIGGVKFPYTMTKDDARPSRQRVIAAGASLPEQPESTGPIRPQGARAFSIYIRSTDILALRGTDDEHQTFWAQYENARRETWETRNPAERGGELKIRRVRFRRFRRWQQRRRLTKLHARGLELERQARRELVDGMQTGEAGPKPEPE